MHDFCRKFNTTDSSFQRKLKRFTTAKLVNPVPFTLTKSLDDSLRSPLRGHPSDVLRAARYVQLSLG
jgi:hypothetical protein